ncbi:LCP family protein required for cell wall assembly [Oikeobacillus pervagus]|uniref:Polyisoprenyl-teichoic acid--peptidoglycan teichoic acid transferase TagU n=1 Tax=Oikeobacillus pervagus TaxID=1325931 RepID=A0AAJ1WK56_9BACI|nr:LytR family transcriptional regulator [Oikeobacillus pervagus]MDQ0216223.1 LCP family protein required for cell wall assembly [Oikeobacillus pervagus]
MIGSRKSKKRRKRQRFFTMITTFFIILLIFTAGYSLFVYRSFQKTLDTVHEPLEDREISEKRTSQPVLEKKHPFSVLLLGVDERKNDKGRSDTIIVLAVNPDRNSVEMISIPRDTKTEMVGKGKEDKINHAYAFGGINMALQSVENLLDIPIDYYIKVNMEGFQDIVDAVGGIQVDNQLDFVYEGTHFKKGSLTLNGQDALKYSRMRKLDPRGDFGRQERQRKVIQGVIKKGASLSSLWKYQEIFYALGENVRTNLTFNEMKDIQKRYKDAAHNITQIEVKGTSQKMNGIYYFIVADDEKKRIRKLLRTQLDLENLAELREMDTSSHSFYGINLNEYSFQTR